MSSLKVPQLITCLLFCWLSIPGFSGSISPALQAVHQRLLLMQEVAAYKWLHQLPIEDLQREAVIVNAASLGALRYGINPRTSKHFFQAQIFAAKEIQLFWFTKWETGDAPLKALDLIGDIRPQLLRLGDEILRQLSAGHSLPESSDLFPKVQGLSRTSQQTLVNALENIHLYPNRLAQILDTGQLRIGTTGDYAPFSIQTSAQADINMGPTYSGVDIQMAQNLARYMHVKAVFVPTTWPTLMADLKAGLFDIVMSGVSRTPERETVAFFTRAYLTGGKTAIVRCSDVDKLNTLAHIDQPGVRIIVNPGGTNERFVKANIHGAQIEIFDDNRSIFSKIIQGDADVMITDRIEVTHQSNLHPELCAAMKNNLTHQEKAYLLPRDKKLQALVNTWLELRIAQGFVSGLFNEALHP